MAAQHDYQTQTHRKLERGKSAALFGECRRSAEKQAKDWRTERYWVSNKTCNRLLMQIARLGTPEKARSIAAQLVSAIKTR